MQQNGFICLLFDYLMTLYAERNLNPKAACLKRREEEKADEYSASHNVVAASDAVLHSSVVCLLLSSVIAHVSNIINVTFIVTFLLFSNDHTVILSGLSR